MSTADHPAQPTIDELTTPEPAAPEAGAHQPGASPELDTGRLAEITDRDGFTVFDPAVPGGVRELTTEEQHRLDRDLVPSTELTPSVQVAEAAEGEHGLGWRSKPEHLWTAFDRNEAYLETRPVGGPYDPALDFGHPDWREPESDAEAAARTAHLDAERDANPPTAPMWREPTPVEDALDQAAEDASLADRAHDSDPALWERYRDLLALDQLQPTGEREIDDDFPEDEYDEDVL